jgi:hypothetical protein
VKTKLPKDTTKPKVIPIVKKEESIPRSTPVEQTNYTSAKPMKVEIPITIPVEIEVPKSTKPNYVYIPKSFPESQINYYSTGRNDTYISKSTPKEEEPIVSSIKPEPIVLRSTKPENVSIPSSTKETKIEIPKSTPRTERSVETEVLYRGDDLRQWVINPKDQVFGNRNDPHSLIIINKNTDDIFDDVENSVESEEEGNELSNPKDSVISTKVENRNNVGRSSQNLPVTTERFVPQVPIPKGNQPPMVKVPKDRKYTVEEWKSLSNNTNKTIDRSIGQQTPPNVPQTDDQFNRDMEIAMAISLSMQQYNDEQKRLEDSYLTPEEFFSVDDMMYDDEMEQFERLKQEEESNRYITHPIKIGNQEPVFRIRPREPIENKLTESSKEQHDSRQPDSQEIQVAPVRKPSDILLTVRESFDEDDYHLLDEMVITYREKQSPQLSEEEIIGSFLQKYYPDFV